MNPLIAEAQRALATQTERVATFSYGGKTYLAKRLLAQKRSVFKARLLQLLVRLITGKWMPIASFTLNTDASFEVKRLLHMKDAGICVPEVLFASDEFFVMPHCGTVVATLLEGFSEPEWRPLFMRLAEELADFHRQGLWHGGAQIKNITYQKGVSYRIDFEECFGEFLPISVAQAADLVLFLNSISLAGPVNEGLSRALLPALLQTYFAGHPSADIKACLRKVLPFLRFALFIAKPFEGKSRKSVRRLRILYAVFRAM